MYPVLFRIGHFTVSTYGVVLAIAVFAALSLFARALRHAGGDPDDAWSIGTWALLGGIVGAKLYYVILHQDPGALLSGSGLVWYGGLIGGAAAAAYAIRRRRLPFLGTLDALAPAAAVGHAIGHIGCFFSGDSYGLPSTLPWAVAFPRGMPPSTAGNLRTEFGVEIPAGIPDSAILTVHPTMLYSTLILGGVAALLWWVLRKRPPVGLVLGLYLVLAGVERFFIEFLRAKDDRFLAWLTTAQAIAILLVSTGAILIFNTLRARSGRVPVAAVADAATGAAGRA
jgi:phosphatidylglycerol:prolipoprotein diacylglycerol transferase